LDGSQHLENKSYDAEREKYFASIGITTLRFWNSEVDINLDGVIEKIRNTTSPLAPLLKGEGKPPSATQEKGVGG
jgi:very-short-patch-repair endonuclease